MDDRTITCTFNSTLDTILGQGFTGLQGNGTALVRASAAIDSANVMIDANGKQIEVPVPGGKIADNVGLEYKPQWMSKWGSDVTSTSKKVDWVVTFGPDQVKESAVLAMGTMPLTMSWTTMGMRTMTAPIRMASVAASPTG